MMAGSPATRGISPDFVLSDAEFDEIAARAHSDFGLNLQRSKKDLVHSRLVKRLRALSLGDFRSYCAFIDTPEGQAERLKMLSALTTNVTHFFREAHHFQLLRETILPPLIARARAGGRVRMWSAGCSAGQEPYSIAATVIDLFPDVSRFDFKILATDVDPAILAKARTAQYPDEERDAVPTALQSKMCESSASSSGHFAVQAAVRDLITFAELNLIGRWPMRGQFDAIFCRNVAIYFDKDTQARLWSRFAEKLPEGGFLIIGHSERLSSDTLRQFDSVGVTAFQKTSAAPDGQRHLT